MTSLSSVAGTDNAPTATSTATTSNVVRTRRMADLLSKCRCTAWSHFQDRDAVAPDQRAQQQHSNDDDREQDGAERARDARVAVLHLRQDRHRSEIKARIYQED